METPEIVRCNTYFWRPGSSASGRRANEKRHHTEVAAWLESFGFTLGYRAGMEQQFWGDFDGKHVEVRFLYMESCHNVYKRLQVWVNGKRSNIRGLESIIRGISHV